MLKITYRKPVKRWLQEALVAAGILAWFTIWIALAMNTMSTDYAETAPRRRILLGYSRYMVWLVLSYLPWWLRPLVVLYPLAVLITFVASPIMRGLHYWIARQNQILISPTGISGYSNNGHIEMKWHDITRLKINRPKTRKYFPGVAAVRIYSRKFPDRQGVSALIDQVDRICNAAFNLLLLTWFNERTIDWLPFETFIDIPEDRIDCRLVDVMAMIRTFRPDLVKTL